VNFDSFGASSLDFFIYTFTKTTDWIEYHHVKQKVLVAVIDIIEGQGAEFAFPTSTIHLPELASNGAINGMPISADTKTTGEVATQATSGDSKL